MSREETLYEYDAICREVIEHLSRVWWAFDPTDSRAEMIRKLCQAYESRRVAAACGMPDPHITDPVNDEMGGRNDVCE
jgi:hypothetical protein